MDETDKILNPREPHFLERVCQYLVHGKNFEELGEILDLRGEYDLVQLVRESGLQDAGAIRHRRRAFLLAQQIINDRGEWNGERAAHLFRLWQEGGHLFYAEPLGDSAAHEHVLQVLEKCAKERTFAKSILKFSLPLCHSYAESLIRASLFLRAEETIEHAHVRRAVLSACLTYLRQSVGSCFATAPAIVIQTEQLDHLVADLQELLSTGRLKRIFDGVEYPVPMSPSWGIGDLRKDLLTIARTKSVWKSPGLLAGCRAAGLEIESSDQIRIWMQELVKKHKQLTSLELFEELLLKKYQINRERLESFRTRRSLPSRMILTGGAFSSDLACEEFESAFQKARSACCTMVDHPLLKSWEFTLASFSESKMEFSRWNLYASLGLDPQKRGGIGEALSQVIDRQIEEANQKIEELHQSYEIAFDRVRGAEVLLRQASSEAQIRRRKAEYESQLYHMRVLLEMRDTAYEKGNKFTSLLNFLIKQYDTHFPLYFQEIYDPEMFDLQAGPYEDSMAGFRLVYKHGRNDPSLWTMIRTQEQYVEALIDFFKMSETQITTACVDGEVAKEVSRLTTLVIGHVRTAEFIESALQRMRDAHQADKFPTTAPDMLTGEKKPWAYVSGGTMETLLKTYYRFSGHITTEGRWVESAEDLLVFLLDALKGLPLSTAELFHRSPNRSMLMHSPNHAFILHPGWERFYRGWQENVFSYTWVRDQVVEPAKRFFASMALSPVEQQYLAEHWMGEQVSFKQKEKQDFFVQKEGGLSVEGFVQQLLGPREPNQKDLTRLDAFLLKILPLVPGSRWKECVLLLQPEETRESVRQLLEKESDDLYTYVGACELQDLAKGFYLLATRSMQHAQDVHSAIRKSALHAHLQSPEPLLFADANWPHYYFGFALGPASGRLRLWRLNTDTMQGVPMGEWEMFLNGEAKLPWAILTNRLFV